MAVEVAGGHFPKRILFTPKTIVSTVGRDNAGQIQSHSCWWATVMHLCAALGDVAKSLYPKIWLFQTREAKCRTAWGSFLSFKSLRGMYKGEYS